MCKLSWDFVYFHFRGSKICSFGGGMDKNGLLLVLLVLFTIDFGCSNVFNPRKLVTNPDPNGSSNANQDPLLSSPPPEEKKQNPSVGELKPKDTPTSPSDLESKGLNNADRTKSTENSSDKKLDKGKSQDGKEKVENQDLSKSFGSINCKGNQICRDPKKTMFACIQDIENGSNKLTLVLHNEQDINLNVTIIYGSSMTNTSLPGHGTEKVNITSPGEKSTKVVLKAGNGNCELQIDQTKTMTINDSSKPSDANDNSKPKDITNTTDSPAKPKDIKNPTNSPVNPKEGDNPPNSNTDDSLSKGKETNSPTNPKDIKNPGNPKYFENPGNPKDIINDPSKSQEVDDPSKSSVPTKPTSLDAQKNFLNQLSFYSKQVTPTYGAYVAFLLALVIGGSWALCSFRKRRTNGGVPYQELEMGPTESSAHMEAAEGWDADWDDDDWDEDKAIRSPGISSNGLTSRTTKKDGWDSSWND